MMKTTWAIAEVETTPQAVANALSALVNKGFEVKFVLPPASTILPKYLIIASKNEEGVIQ